MDKQTIITLLKKDIAELMQLTEGFDQISQCPKVLIDLALQKARSVEQILNELQVIPQKPVAEPNNHTQKEEIIERETTPSEQTFTTEQPVSVENTTIHNEEPAPQDVQIEVEIPTQTQETHTEEQLNVETEEVVVENTPENPVEELTEQSNQPEEVIEQTIQEIEEEEEDEDEEEEVEIEEDDEDEEQETEEELLIEVTPIPEVLTRNDSIVNSKIDDISKAISLGDRFLFQRELFANNGELMQKTIAHLNTLTSIEEAQTYLLKKFTWDKESTTVERFMQLISRRYL